MKAHSNRRGLYVVKNAKAQYIRRPRTTTTKIEGDFVHPESSIRTTMPRPWVRERTEPLDQIALDILNRIRRYLLNKSFFLIFFDRYGKVVPLCGRESLCGKRKVIEGFLQ